MQKPNYRHLKRRREEEQKKEQQQKQARRGRVPDPVPGEPGPDAGMPRT